MAEIATILFSAVALVCGIITSFWIFKLRENVVAERYAVYALSALVAISFLLSFPLWILFSEFFDFVPLAVNRLSYFVFSIGYCGVLLLSYLAVVEISGMQQYIQKVKTSGHNNKEVLSKLRQLDKKSQELEQLKQLAVSREMKIMELLEEIENLRKKGS